MRTGTIAALALAPMLRAGASALATDHGTAAGGATAAAGDGDRVVEVMLSKWRIELSTARVAPGRVVFRIRNAGSCPHAFGVEREGDEFEVRSDTLAAGTEAGLVVELPAGTYELEAYCPLPGHRERGMVTEPEVSG